MTPCSISCRLEKRRCGECAWQAERGSGRWQHGLRGCGGVAPAPAEPTGPGWRWGVGSSWGASGSEDSAVQGGKYAPCQSGVCVRIFPPN